MCIYVCVSLFSVQFTDSLVFAVCCDSGGSVYELEFKYVTFFLLFM